MNRGARTKSETSFLARGVGLIAAVLIQCLAVSAEGSVSVDYLGLARATGAQLAGARQPFDSRGMRGAGIPRLIHVRDYPTDDREIEIFLSRQRTLSAFIASDVRNSLRWRKEDAELDWYRYNSYRETCDREGYERVVERILLRNTRDLISECNIGLRAMYEFGDELERRLARARAEGDDHAVAVYEGYLRQLEETEQPVRAVKDEVYAFREDIRWMQRNIEPFPEQCAPEAAGETPLGEPDAGTTPAEDSPPAIEPEEPETPVDTGQPPDAGDTEATDHDEPDVGEPPAEPAGEAQAETDLQRLEREWTERIPAVPADCCDATDLDALERRIADLKKTCIEIADEARTQQKYIRQELEEAKDTPAFQADPFAAQMPFLERIRAWRRIEEAAEARFDELNACLLARLDPTLCPTAEEPAGESPGFRITRAIEFSSTIPGAGYPISGTIWIGLAFTSSGEGVFSGDGLFEYRARSYPRGIQEDYFTQHEGTSLQPVTARFEDGVLRLDTPIETAIFSANILKGAPGGWWQSTIEIPEQWLQFGFDPENPEAAPADEELVFTPPAGNETTSQVHTTIEPIGGE